MNVFEAIAQRRSVRKYRTDRPITDAELNELFGHVARTPTSFNLQHPRYVVVRDPEHRRRLSELSWGQRQVEMAGAVIIVLGYLKAHRDVLEIYGNAPEAVRERLVPMIGGLYQGRPQLQRDEAIRSGSLASMTLMLAAEAMGLATCPMIGFDPEAVSEYLGVDENHIPVMMICLGTADETPSRLSTRFPISRVVHLERADGPPLEAS